MPGSERYGHSGRMGRPPPACAFSLPAVKGAGRAKGTDRMRREGPVWERLRAVLRGWEDVHSIDYTVYGKHPLGRKMMKAPAAPTPHIEQECQLGEISRDYGEGLLHLAWLWEKGARTLIFAQFELFPTDCAAPEESIGPATFDAALEGKLDPREQCARLFENGRIFYIRKKYPAAALVELYRRLAITGELPMDWCPPGAKCTIDSPVAVPAGPCLALSKHEDREDSLWSWPYIAQAWGDVRCQHCFPEGGADGLEPVLSDETPAKWLKERLCWDISQYPHLWGSAHLTLPNPLYSAIACKIIPPEKNDGGGWGIRFHVEKRESAVDARLDITLLQRDHAGVTAWAPVPLDLEDKCDLLFTTRNEPGQISYMVSSPGRGLLSCSPFRGFIKSMVFGVAIAEQGKVRIESGKTRREVRRDALEHAAEVTLGEAPAMESLGARIALRQRELAERQNARDAGEEWLDDPMTARERIAKILRPAKDVLIVDPYFCDDDLLGHVVTSCARGAKIRILTSAKGLGSNAAEKKANVEALRNLANMLNSQANWDIEVLAMTKNPAIHDRFLVIDNTAVWFSGASLNHIGCRGSIITKLNDPSLVIDKINAVLRDGSRVRNILRDTLPEADAGGTEGRE